MQMDANSRVMAVELEARAIEAEKVDSPEPVLRKEEKLKVPLK